MDQKSSPSFESNFTRFATIVGFIVDTVALIKLFSTFRLQAVSSAETRLAAALPKIYVVQVPLGWKEIILVVIIYSLLAVVFYIRSNSYQIVEVDGPSEEEGLDEEVYPARSVIPLSKKNPLFFAMTATSVLMLTTFVWALVFLLPSSTLWGYMYYLLISWVLGTVLALAGLRWVFIDRKDLGITCKKVILALAFCLPGLGLTGGWLFHTSTLLFFLEFGTIIWASIIYAVLVYLACALLWGATWIVAKWYYGGQY